MLRSHLLWKLYAGYSALIIICTLVFSVLISQRIERQTRADIRQSLEVRAVLLRNLSIGHFQQLPDTAFQDRIGKLGRKIETRLTVINIDGTVIADSSTNPAGMDNHGTRPEVVAARTLGRGTATRFSDTLGEKRMYLALPVQHERHIVGYARTSLSLAEIDKRVNDVRIAVLKGAGLVAVAALLLGLFAARHFIRPIVSMTRVAESMSDGNYDQRLPATRQDEIGTLAKGLNRLAASCRDRLKEIDTDRNKLAAILSGMVDGVIAIGKDERVVHMNEAAGRLLGIVPEEAIGKPIWEITRFQELCQMLRDALGDGNTLQKDMELANSARDQSVEIHGSPLHDGQGAIVGAVVVLHDTSELHRLEMVRRDFVASASHELKTPITAIRALVETLIDDKELPASKRDRFLDKIRDQSVRLSSLVTDLLTLSRLESEGRNVEQIGFDLRHVCLDSAKALLPMAEERGITLETKVPALPIEVLGDEEAVGQIITNLLDNAIKYTTCKGRVWLRAKRQDGMAIIDVQDTGIGICVQDQDRVFERFYRVDKARSRELGGTGLGLSIVKHIALVHGGRVTLESSPGTGSTFRVFLPLASASEQQGLPT